MNLSFTLAAVVVGLVAVALLLWMGRRLRRRAGQQRDAEREALDTIAGWPPEAARILSINERQAYDLLHRAMPGYLVLAQVPLSRFIRVPTRHSYADWLARVGSLSADLMLCDAGSRVLAVIDVRPLQESERSRRRHERMTRVLRAARVQVLTWREGELPTLADVRSALTRIVAPGGNGPPRPRVAGGSSSRPMPLIPVADIAEVLAEGDRAAVEAEFDANLEPLPSGYYDDDLPPDPPPRR